MPVRDRIIQKLSDTFTPGHLEVIDESHKHAGHSGWREGGETHFRVRIASPHFAGMSRLAQHRAIMETLDAELKDRVHALAIEVIAPGAPVNLPAGV
jgi:BolA family transcriptional regulator, general stress-responsive regulator